MQTNSHRETEGATVAQFVCMQPTPPSLPAYTRVRSKGQMHG